MGGGGGVGANQNYFSSQQANFGAQEQAPASSAVVNNDKPNTLQQPVGMVKVLIFKNKCCQLLLFLICKIRKLYF